MNFTNIIKKGAYRLHYSLKRFPYALTFSTLTTIILIYLINMESYYKPETLEIFARLAMASALAFPLFLIIKVFFERKNNLKIIYKGITRIIGLIIIISYYIFLLKETNMVTMTRYIAVSLSLYLIFLVVPYIYKKNNFELYVVNIFSRLLITGIYSVVLMAGISAIIFTINELLNVPVSEMFYMSTALTIGGIFAPIFLLANIFKQNESFNLKDYPSIFEILLLYIIMPLITVYSSILYIYFIKILIIQQLPEGLVTHLVLWYVSFSIILLFFISPLKTKNKWVKTFSKWLPIALIPLLLMMFLAIGIRINTYGFTENRYLVVLLGLWNMGIAFYYIFTEKKNNIILPLSLAIIALLAVFGPWSTYSVSIYSQNNRFENIINKYDMVKNNTIVKSKKQITVDDQEEIQAILKYFENNHQFEDLKYLPDDFQTSNTEQLFGFSYQEKINQNQSQKFSYNFNNNKQAISIQNYDYLFHISDQFRQIRELEGNLTVKMNDSDKEIRIAQNDKILYHRSLFLILLEVHQKIKDIPTKNLRTEDLVFIDENENFKLKYIFNSFYVENIEANPEEANMRNIDYYLLIKPIKLRLP